jgi:MSHA biogenesis protein MshE
MESKRDVRQVVRDFYRDGQEEEASSKASDLGILFYDLRFTETERDAMSYLSMKEARDFLAIPISVKMKKLILGLVNPEDGRIDKLISSLVDNYGLKEVEKAVISKPSCDERIDAFANITKKKTLHEQKDALTITEKSKIGLANLAEEIKKADLQDMLSELIYVAVRAQASDIHIEPEESQARIRFRLDGVLHLIASVNRERYKYLLSQMN